MWTCEVCWPVEPLSFEWLNQVALVTESKAFQISGCSLAFQGSDWFSVIQGSHGQQGGQLDWLSLPLFVENILGTIIRARVWVILQEVLSPTLHASHVIG